MDIAGTTRLLAIVGDPVNQVRTPSVMNAIIRDAGVDAVLVPFHVSEPTFENVMPGILGLANLDGLVITYPFKERALAFVQQATKRAQLVHGINAMARGKDGHWIGDMFDGLGLVHAIEARRAVAGSKVLLMGAGGAGRAIGLALAEAAAASVTVVDLNADRMRILVEEVAASYPGCSISQAPAVAAGHDIIVNATPVGMKAGDGLPMEVGPLSSAMTVADIVLASGPTPLLRAATAAGADVVSGAAMVQAQASAILTFFGVPRSPAG